MAQLVGHTRGRSAAIDMTGQVCGTWTVLRREPHQVNQRGLRWVARHLCGAEHVLLGFALRHKPPVSCRTCNPTRSNWRALELRPK